MRLTTIIKPAALAVALTIGAAPAFADQRDQNGRAKSRPVVGRAVERQDRNARNGADRNYRYEQRGRVQRPVVRLYDPPRYQYRQPYRYGGFGGLVGSLGLRFNLGGVRVGIFAGRPFPYRYGYAVPAYRYRYPIRVVPGVRYGGVSFLVAPTEAAVYVDGNYVGIARDFYGGEQPLPLAPGVHRVELQAQGYAPMVFDVDVLPGQVIPYEGSLRPL